MDRVFVPAIGFRPAGTRTLRERAETSADATTLAVVALAAAPGRTDVVVEWGRTGDPACSPPGSRVLEHSNMAPLEHGLSAELVAGPTTVRASGARRRAYHMSHHSIGAMDALVFPAIPPDVADAELRLGDGTSRWRLPFSVVPGAVGATALPTDTTRAGVTVRATALCRLADELFVELEVEAPAQIRQVGAPVPSPADIPADRAEDRRARRAELLRMFGAQAEPIVLEDDAGGRHAELRRLFEQEPQRAADGGPYISRFSVAFDAPRAEVRHAALVIPFVELNDLGPSVTSDLTTLPLDVALAEHRFRVVSSEPYGAEERRLVMELSPSRAAARFVQPARVHGAGPEFGWQRHAVDGGPTAGRAIWMATKVGDPPIVTFAGVVLRVDGPLRLDLPLGEIANV